MTGTSGKDVTVIHKHYTKDRQWARVTFWLSSNQCHGKASLVGDFNNWDPTVHPLVHQADSTCSTVVTLEAGRRYLFRYCCEDGSWLGDSEADAYEPSGYDSENCVLLT